jgi:hypothetical protein
MDKTSIDLMCKEVVELVTDYLGHKLAPADRVRFEKHLLTCPPCTAYLGQMRTTVELAGELGRRPPDDEVEQTLVNMFRRWHQK